MTDEDKGGFNISDMLEKEVFETAINEFLGDKKEDARKMIKKILEMIKKDRYYFLYYMNDELYLSHSTTENCKIDIKNSEKLTSIKLTDYVELIDSI